MINVLFVERLVKAALQLELGRCQKNASISHQIEHGSFGGDTPLCFLAEA